MIHRLRARTSDGSAGNFAAVALDASAPDLPPVAAVVTAAATPTASATTSVTTRRRFIQPLLVHRLTAPRARGPAAASAAGTVASARASAGPGRPRARL